MKRTISTILTAVLAAALLSGCSGGVTVSTGLGITTSIKSSVSAQDGKDGTAQIDSAVAAITLDSDGTIVKLTIDAPQTRVVFSGKGKITSGLTAVIQSKLEKGDNYGMKGISGIGREWYEQIAALENWAIGKTVDEVLGLKTIRVDDSRPQVPDDPELTASVTITVGDYMKAIEKAAASAKQASASEVFLTGLGIITKIDSSTDAQADADGYAQADSIIAAVTVDDKGKLVSCSIDAARTRVTFGADGVLTADFSAEIKTAGELGDDFGTQAAAFADWAVGKTVKEIKESKPSTVSIDVGDLAAAVEKAVANAK